jgi:hypothetical protein
MAGAGRSHGSIATILTGIALALMLSAATPTLGAVAAQPGVSEAASRLSYNASVQPGSGVVVTMRTRAAEVSVRWQEPRQRSTSKGTEVALASRSVRLKVVHGSARLVLPTDAVRPRAKAGRSGWTELAVTPASPGVSQVVAGSQHACTLMADGTVKCWGGNTRGQVGDGTSYGRTTPATVVGLSDVRSVAAGGDRSCAVMSDGTVRCWGAVDPGELSLGSAGDQSRPVAVAGVGEVTALSMGEENTCAIRSDATVTCWGSRLPRGDTVRDPLVPIPIPAWTGATALFIGEHSCAVLSGGTVSCLVEVPSADGASGSDYQPVTVPGIADAKSVMEAFGIQVGGSMCALLGNGTVKCWWLQEPDSIGSSPAPPAYPAIPVAVTGLSGVTQMVAAETGLCALAEGGKVRCWAEPSRNGGPVPSKQVTGVTGAVMISGHCALLGSGRVRCWERNDGAERGDGSNRERPQPSSVAGLHDVVAIFGISGGMVQLRDGTFRAWGANSNGILGDGTRATRFAPVPVAGLGSQVSAGASDPGVTSPSAPSAQLAGSFEVLGDGRVSVRVVSEAARVKLTYRTAKQRARKVVVALQGGAGNKILPPGANTIQAQALAGPTLRASAALVLGPVPDPSGAAQLTATGMLLAGAPPTGRDLAGRFADDFLTKAPTLTPQIVTDGTGAIWVKGMWRLTRIDPVSGQSQSWDAADDGAFATMEQITPAAGGGVWLVGGNRIRHFDGQRILADLTVPAEIFTTGAGPSAVGHIHDLVDVGTGLWVSLHDIRWDTSWLARHKTPGRTPARRVARWSHGQWKVMSTAKQSVSGYLAVDRDGGVWSGDWAMSIVARRDSTSYEESAKGPRRWEGRSWVLPGRNRALVAKEYGKILADPTGGVWLLTKSNKLLHFDGHKWRLVTTDLSAAYENGWSDAWEDSELSGSGSTGVVGPWITVAADGAAWLAGSHGVARFTSDGSLTTYGPDQGLALAPVAAPIATGDDVLILDSTGVLRLSGGRFTRIWTDQLVLQAPVGGLTAIASDQVWVQGADFGDRGRWYLRAGGSWQPVGEATRTQPWPDGNCGAVLAGDGAVWTTTRAGLTRTAGGQTTVIAAELTDCPVAAGPEGSVWIGGRYGASFANTPGSTSGFLAYRPDGTTITVPAPPGPDKACYFRAGRTGTLLVTMVPEDCDDDGRLDPALWDGATWTRLPAPAPGGESQYPIIADDGSIWALAAGGYPTQRGLSRYADGRWQVIAEFPSGDSYTWYRDLVPAPNGRACLLVDEPGSSAITCYNPGGQVARFDTTGMPLSAFSIAPDGAIWVRGPQVARLAVLPTS